MRGKLLEDRILRTNELANLLGVSRQTVWKLSRRDDFPKKIQIGTSISGWWFSEIKEWINRANENNPQRAVDLV